MIMSQLMMTHFKYRIAIPKTAFLLAFLLITHICLPQSNSTIPIEAKKSIDEFIQKGIEFENSGDFNQASSCYHQAGNIYWTHGYLAESIEQFKNALLMSEKLTSLNSITLLNTKIGLLYSELKSFETSLTYFSKSLEIARKMARKQDVVSALLNVANSYNELERYSETLPYLNEAEVIAKDLNDSKLLRNCYSLMTRVYDKIGDREKSTYYFNLFAAISKGIQQQEVAKKESEARMMVDQANSKVLEVESDKQATVIALEQKKKELNVNQENLQKVEQLTKEQQMQIDLQNAEIVEQRLRGNILMGIIIAVLIIAGLTYFGYQKIKRQNFLLNAKNVEISRQKNEIEKQAEELSDLNALKDKLFSIISHDLRSPLASLISMLNMSKEGHFTLEEQQSILTELSKNVEYNTELLENLLKWASSQMKGSLIRPIVFDIKDVVTNKIQLYEKAARLKGIEIIDNTIKDTNVFADKDMIEIVVRNLITNAIKFSEDGDEISITSSSKNGTVCVCVADNGLGIPKEAIGKLFGKQVFSTRGTQNEKGTGLGLILCKDFVHRNEGDIWVESQENVGSKFYFILPASNS